jgi:ABC-2 type transport system permease protein
MRAMAPIRACVGFVEKTLVVAELEARKLRHDPTELLTRAIQPALWFVVLGGVFTRTHAIPTGGLPYMDFMAPGILAQSVLFIAIFYGIAVIWERDLGLVHKLLVSPAPRAALAGVVVVLLLGAACFSTLSLIIAALVKTRERFMGIGQILTMPLFFASNAIYPVAIMPPWLRVCAQINPLTYEVDALRALMLPGASSVHGLGLDAGVLIAALTALVLVGARVYPRIAT